MTKKQRRALEILGYKYGNGGCCATRDNHAFFQRHLAGKPEEAALLNHRITSACREAFDRVMVDDYREFSVETKRRLDAVESGMLC